MQNEKVVEDIEQYSVVLAEDKKTLLLNWKRVTGLSIEDFRMGVVRFADQCKTHKPIRAVIDARKLDPGEDPVAWVSGQKKFTNEEEYAQWWTREIVPIYHEAGIASLSVATGNPNAPGELAEVPPGVNFKIGYFDDLESAMQWEST